MKWIVLIGKKFKIISWPYFLYWLNPFGHVCESNAGHFCLFFFNWKFLTLKVKEKKISPRGFMRCQWESFSSGRCLTMKVIIFAFLPEFLCSICCTHHLQREDWHCHVPTPEMKGGSNCRQPEKLQSWWEQDRPDKKRGTLFRAAVRQKTRSEEIVQHQQKYNNAFLNHKIKLGFWWWSQSTDLKSRGCCQPRFLWSMSYAGKKRVPIPGWLPKLSFSIGFFFSQQRGLDS